MLYIDGNADELYLDGNADEVAHLTSHMAQMTKQKPWALSIEHRFSKSYDNNVCLMSAQH